MRKEVARSEMMRELKQLQEGLTEEWIDRSLPEGWDGFESAFSRTPKQERVTIRLDADMVAWFRKLGPGYGPRMNAILRIYWLSLVSGQVKSHWDEAEVSPQFEAALMRRIEARRARRQER